MRVTPPGYEFRNEHTISLNYQGPSSLEGAPQEGVFGQFDSFSIPIFEHVESSPNGVASAFGNFASILIMVATTTLIFSVFYLV